MKRQSPTQPKNARKFSDAILAERYFELQRLRHEVRKAEINRPMDAPYSSGHRTTVALAGSSWRRKHKDGQALR
jgi:hypothetical protein